MLDQARQATAFMLQELPEVTVYSNKTLIHKLLVRIWAKAEGISGRYVSRMECNYFNCAGRRADMASDCASRKQP